MTILETDMNSPIFRGLQVVCEDCRSKNDADIWLCLYVALRENGHQNTKAEKMVARDAAEFHESQHPTHRIHIWHMKKLV